jgi:endonuclease-3
MVGRLSMASRGKPLARLVERLRQTYPEARCELEFRTPLELLIATILSAQTTDKQVNAVTRGLFAKYPRAADYARAPLPQLEADLKRIGLYRNKARHIQACCQTLVAEHQGEVPRAMTALTQLAGVGRKTANVLLGNAFHLSEGIVVDTHVARLSARLGLTREKAPEKIERDLMRLIPARDWILFSHWLIWHGRRRCFARRPDCDSCELQNLCPSRGQHSQGSLPAR